MWDTAEMMKTPIARDMPCSECGHASHTYLACSDECPCVPRLMAGVSRVLARRSPVVLRTAR